MEAAGIEPAQDSPGICINCPAPADHSFALASGRIANLCGDCAASYRAPFVYFIRGGDLVKIGTSRDVDARLRNHQASSPLPLELWHVVAGDATLVPDRRFAADRVRGEWFRVSDDIRDYVDRTRTGEQVLGASYTYDRRRHQSGFVLPDRGDGLHWLRCVDCGREWAERDSGAYARGSRVCAAAAS